MSPSAKDSSSARNRVSLWVIGCRSDSGSSGTSRLLYWGAIGRSWAYYAIAEASSITRWPPRPLAAMSGHCLFEEQIAYVLIAPTLIDIVGN